MTQPCSEQGESIKHGCGIMGVYGCPDAVDKVYYGLYALQHRGEESAGIASTNGKVIQWHKGMGLVSQVFTPEDLKRLRNHAAIGHVRYSTVGLSHPLNAQPLVGECSFGGSPAAQIAIAHNGQLTEAVSQKRLLESQGSLFQTTCDTEIILHLMARTEFHTDLGKLFKNLKGSFSLLILTQKEMIAVRDPGGFRPLCLGKLEGGGYVLASESCALDQAGAEYIREVAPGEIIYINKDGMRAERFAPERPSYCIFELIYFSRPDSRFAGQNVHLFRKALGIKLAEEQPAEADIVIPVPEGGNSAAMGYSQASGIPLDRGFIRNHYVGRTFILPRADSRSRKAEIKLNAIPEVVRGKRVVVVDDSIVRGTTSKSRFSLLRKAGAKEIHVRISCPPHRYPCYYGIDFQIKEELIAATRSLKEMPGFLDVDSLGYLSIEGMLSCTTSPKDYCIACFAGKYPIPVGEEEKKTPSGSPPHADATHEEREERVGEHTIVV
ncbi:MAG TPA: amidophosphoribosyltransferase [Candidatus Tripitaka californicus]|uniref:amidophosphoribosyltransferase n=1 Tax=Candidatus Tripitaka californicus TaxID=3367616 RepID=UPI004027EFA2|nr:amidophosphoribosyltransferase [Planctomycetota bacterium]